MTRHLTDDELVLRYYGEMTDAADTEAGAHLDGCAACRDNLARLERVLALADDAPSPAADAGLEARIWDRLAPELAAPAVRRRLPAAGYFAAAAVLVLAAFVAGRMSVDPVAPPPVTAAAPVPAADRVLDLDLSDHLDRAETALVAFLERTGTGDAAAGVPAGTDDLIAANRLYRSTATALGNDTVVAVLDELERALIEIAAAPDTDADEQDAVRTWIDSRGLVFKVRVIRESTL